MKMKTVLILLPALGYGGVERLCLALSQTALDHGFRLILVAKSGALTQELPDEANFSFIDLDMKKKGPVAFFKARWALNQLILEHKPDLIHSHSRWPSWIAKGVCDRYQIPFVTTAHNVHGHSNFFKRFYSQIQQKGRPWIAVSAYVANKNAALYPKQAEQLALLPIGADQQRLQLKPKLVERAKQLREQWGNKQVIVVPSRISTLYDNSLILKAVGKIRGIDVKLLFIGGYKSNRALDELQSKAQTFAPAVKTEFMHSDIDFLPSLMAANLCLSIAKKPGAFGMAIAEAQSLGCPVIASALGGAIEQIDNPHAKDLGSLLVSSNVDELAQKIELKLQATPNQTALFDPEARATQPAARKIREIFSLQSHLDGTVSVYQNVLNLDKKVEL